MTELVWPSPVPSASAPHALAFCASVVPGAAPELVEHAPLLGEPMKECFSIVPKQVAAHGGEQLNGWCIWQAGGMFVEAEFHAVWKRPAGQLLDITPRPFHASEVLFLADAKREYVGRQVDNVRQSLVRDHDVTRYLFLLRRRFEMLNEGDLANQHGTIALRGKALKGYERLIKEVAQLERRLARRYAP